MGAARRDRGRGSDDAGQADLARARRIKKQFSDEQLSVLISAMYYEIEHLKEALTSTANPEFKAGLKDTLDVADELYDLFAAAQWEGKTT